MKAWKPWAVLVLALAPVAAASARPTLRVCADPNNLPFSNSREEGFENLIAARIAEAFDADLEYHWWPQRRAFVRNTLDAGACDLIVGISADVGRVAPTRPYYASTYVFVTRRADRWRPHSLADPRLAERRIGVHTIGDDYANVPPVAALARRGIVDQVRGYSLYGDYSRPNPPARLIEAVARGEVDVAIAWGPLAGFFAHRSDIPLDVTPIEAGDEDLVAMRFQIAMGVRRGNDELRRRLDAFIARHRDELERVLDRYHVPRTAVTAVDRRSTTLGENHE